ncbi:MAG: hypothetical protein K9M94_11680 [Spirochaetia bacterium]|nr:hypothetical protein [Spirochaetia bacterium]
MTGRASGNEIEQEDLPSRVAEEFEGSAVRFSYTISDDPSLHARYIAADSGWKIVLDRGLDIFQPFDRRDAFSLQNSVQETRRCRAFEITYLRSSR